MTHTKIVAVRATIVRFLFWKYVRSCETILVKMTCDSRNPTKIDRLASFLKCEVLINLLFDQFLSDFNDSHVILTRIVSRLRTYFQNKNRTIVARTATILVCVIEFPRQNWAGWMTHHVIFSGGPHSHCLWYDGTSKSTLKAAMSYMTYTKWTAWEKSKTQ
jgi:hypothetical protein